MKRIFFLQLTLLLLSFNTVFSQIVSDTKALKAAATISNRIYLDNHQKALDMAKKYHWALEIHHKDHSVAFLMGVDQFNHPIYYTTFNNIVAAATVGANQLWPGGSTGLNISGSSSILKNKLAIWDGGGVRGTHKELVGRVTQMDGANITTSDGSIHATHVTGTMMATGINALAKGMSFQLPGIHAYDFNNDVTEMTTAASGLLLSNHSYGTICGWDYDTNGNWVFYGNNGDTADFKFGYYDTESQSWDNIACNAPNYLIVKASGNNRNMNGPAVGGTYYYYDNGTEIQASRPAGISSNNSYQTIGTYGNAKNSITVGAVNGIPNGYSKPSDVVMTPFSSWGPTSDGRIKPDVVADGMNVLSCSALSDSDYTTLSGTSMATPNTTGALMLLQDYYSQLKGGSFMRSATLKGLAIHTADEAGTSQGPDYQFGWGLLDVKKAANVITNAVGSNNSSSSKDLLYERILTNGQTDSIQVVASGSTPITATISWTDPAAAVDQVNVLNNPTPKLINDLDLRINSINNTYFPWILTPTIPAAAATTGDNYLDNVEKIEIDNVVPGQVYTIKVTHKGTLTNGKQAYSLLVSGVGGNQYCTPNTNSKNLGASIDSVSFGEINYAKTVGCTTYNNYTHLTATIKPNQILPINLKISSCDGVVSTKNVKVYIDFNNNGSFLDSGELVATGSVSGINNSFTANIKIPQTVLVGSFSLLRIVAADTNTNNINPCSTFLNGETQDYKVLVAKADNDIALSSFVSPLTGDYASSSQFLTITMTNNGQNAQQNVHLTAIIKKGDAIVATLNGVYPSTITSGSTVTYTFQTPFFSLPATNYTITATATIPIDDNLGNNVLTKNIITAPAVVATANNCNDQLNLKIKNPSGNTQYAWYNTSTATTPVAIGTSEVINNFYSDSLIYLGTGTRTNVGLANKGPYSGGYQANGNNYLNYTSTVPMILESARIYTGFPGTLTIMAADISNATSSGYSYQVLDSKNIDVYATKPTPVSGSLAGNDLTDSGAVFYINMVLPAGSHSIIVSTSDATIYRTNGLAIGQYPFGNSQFKITGNSAATSNISDTNYYKPYYYYLYNMKLKTEDCVGDRLPININISPTPIISISNDSIQSNITNGNQWYLNGNAIVGATASSYLPNSTEGIYFDIVTDSFGCSKQSNPLSIDKIIPFVSPNPANAKMTLSFTSNIANSFSISLLNMAGKKMFVKEYPNFKGDFSEQYNTSLYAAGVYFLEIKHGSYLDRKKVLIFH